MIFNFFKFIFEDSEEDRIFDENVLSLCNIKKQFESNMFYSYICDMGRYYLVLLFKKDKYNINFFNMTIIRFMYGYVIDFRWVFFFIIIKCRNFFSGSINELIWKYQIFRFIFFF